MAVAGGSHGETAQGSLRLIPPVDLLEVLSRRRVTGRVVLMTAATPRRIVALHLESGRPVLVVGSGMPNGATERDDSARARQVLLEALGWSAGAFRVEGGEAAALAAGVRRHDLGDVADLLSAARERARAWPRLAARLPAPVADLWVSPRSVETSGPTVPVHAAILAAVAERMPLSKAITRCGLDDHVAIKAVIDLAGTGRLGLGTEGDVDASDDPALRNRVAALLDLVGRDGGHARTLKITVLSWDSRTCFRTLLAMLGRERAIPEDIERQPRFQVLHERIPLPEPYGIEILAFRSDAFEPSFVAPMVHDCHIFLVVTDIEAGHVWGGEQPLVERLNQIREMFAGTSFAGRITIGAGAVTDPGCDVLLPELGRYVSWNDLHSGSCLSSILATLCDRLGVEITSS